jgi:Tfp pilus assembly protein PilF
MLDDARRYFERACALDPEFHMARMNLGRAYLKQRQFDSAKAAFDRVLASQPDDMAAQALSAYCGQQLDQLKAPAP